MKLVTIHHVIENRHYINCYYIIYQKISLKFIFFIASILSIRLIPTRTSPRNPSFPIILISILKHHPINHCRQLKNEGNWECKKSKTNFQCKMDYINELKTEIYEGGEGPLGWQAVAYGKKLEAPTIKISGLVSLPKSIVSTLNFK